MPTEAAAESADGVAAEASAFAASADFLSADIKADSDPLTIFTPRDDPIRHRIDYEIWDYALKNTVLSMGPSDWNGAPRTEALTGSRIMRGPQSRFRLEGSMVQFALFDEDVVASFTEYREDLERVAAELDIASLPRNEQLAFWLNLHNVALMEQISLAWPVREPREIELDGVPLDDAKFITLRGIPVSLRDIRERIVFRHWQDPKVIYGFWRGEIGGPKLQHYAFTGANVSSLLDISAMDFVNSLRAVEKRGSQLHVATLYEEAARFYFPDFESDLRTHLAQYGDAEVARMLERTQGARPSIREHDIADLAGGRRPASYLFLESSQGIAADDLPQASHRLGLASALLLRDRARKLRDMERRGKATYRIFFSNIDLPGDPPNKNAVE
jgi:hypothetical protein